MGLSNTIAFTSLTELHLDPMNPRLGLDKSQPTVPEERIMELMRSWNLEELAVSFLESGFWPQEAVIVVQEPSASEFSRLVVVEGNRRIAALKYLERAFLGKPITRTWSDMIEGIPRPDDLFNNVPYIIADSREDVIAYLGFRHVTGIKQWEPTQKAEFIATMIDDLGMSYDSVRKQIGMRIDTVRRNYIALRIVSQMDTHGIDFSKAGLDRRFSVLFLSLRESGVRNFLDVNLDAAPENSRSPIPKEKIEDLGYFARWMFGTETQRPLFTDSRYVNSFARMLTNTTAVEYLKSTPAPVFELALQKAGIEDEDIENYLKEASNQMELALSRIHLYLIFDTDRKCDASSSAKR